jgi:hypothetical protein
LAALGTDYRLGVVGLAIFVSLRLAHQLRIGVGEVDLSIRRRGPVGRLGRPAAPSLLGFVGGLFLFVLWPFGLGLCLGFRLQAGAGGVKLLLQRPAPGDLGRQRLRVAVLCVGRLGLGGQFGDVGG